MEFWKQPRRLPLCLHAETARRKLCRGERARSRLEQWPIPAQSLPSPRDRRGEAPRRRSKGKGGSGRAYLCRTVLAAARWSSWHVGSAPSPRAATAAAAIVLPSQARQSGGASPCWRRAAPRSPPAVHPTRPPRGAFSVRGVRQRRGAAAAAGSPQKFSAIWKRRGNR